MVKSGSLPQLARFAIVGLGVMGAFMAQNWAWGHWVGKQAAFILSYPPALALHFCLNKYWTFASPGAARPAGRQIGEYLAMVGVTFLVQWGVFSVLAGLTPLPGWIDAGAANAAQMAITFFFMQRRIFAAAPLGE